MSSQKGGNAGEASDKEPSKSKSKSQTDADADAGAGAGSRKESLEVPPKDGAAPRKTSGGSGVSSDCA